MEGQLTSTGSAQRWQAAGHMLLGTLSGARPAVSSRRTRMAKCTKPAMHAYICGVMMHHRMQLRSHALWTAQI